MVDACLGIVLTLPTGYAWSGVVIPGQSLVSMNGLFLIGINSKSECDVLLSKSITQLAPVMLPLCTRISTIVASLRLSAIANSRQRWLVQAHMTSRIAVAYVTEACLFVSYATFAATASRGRRKQFGDGNFTGKCYQMALREVVWSLPSHPSAIGVVSCRNSVIKFDNRLYVFKTGYRF